MNTRPLKVPRGVRLALASALLLAGVAACSTHAAAATGNSNPAAPASASTAAKGKDAGVVADAAGSCGPKSVAGFVPDNTDGAIVRGGASSPIVKGGLGALVPADDAAIQAILDAYAAQTPPITPNDAVASALPAIKANRSMGVICPNGDVYAGHKLIDKGAELITRAPAEDPDAEVVNGLGSVYRHPASKVLTTACPAIVAYIVADGEITVAWAVCLDNLDVIHFTPMS